MFTVTINGNTLEELFNNLATFLGSKQNASTPAPFPVQPAAPALPTTPAQAPALTLAPTAQAPATPLAATNAATVPTAPAPTYTLDQLARAGATLAQTGKMDQALALLAKYGIQTVNQLKPEQYGAFATELRALGAQV